MYKVSSRSNMTGIGIRTTCHVTSHWRLCVFKPSNEHRESSVIKHGDVRRWPAVHTTTTKDHCTSTHTQSWPHGMRCHYQPKGHRFRLTGWLHGRVRTRKHTNALLPITMHVNMPQRSALTSLTRTHYFIFITVSHQQDASATNLLSPW